MSWPWWFTRTDAVGLMATWVFTAVVLAVLGLLKPDAVFGMSIGTAGYVAICWYSNEPSEAVEASA